MPWNMEIICSLVLSLQGEYPRRQFSSRKRHGTSIPQDAGADERGRVERHGQRVRLRDRRRRFNEKYFHLILTNHSSVDLHSGLVNQDLQVQDDLMKKTFIRFL